MQELKAFGKVQVKNLVKANSPYTINHTHNTYLCDATAGQIIINLQSIGFTITIVKTDSSANTVRISGSIEYTSTLTYYDLTTRGKAVTLIPQSGSTWRIIAVN